MPDEATIYRERINEVLDTHDPDDLVQGICVSSEIKISTAGTYQRGELLMSSGSNEFEAATATGIASATELCILCRDCEVPEGNDVYTAGYFSGTFSGDKVKLAYETESDTHDVLLAQIRIALRRKGIYLN